MSGLTLYQLAAEHRALADRLQDMELPPEAITDTLEGEAGALEAKAVSVVMVARNLEASADAIEAAAKEMQARAKAARTRAGWLREYVLGAMQHAGVERVECPHFRVSVRSNPDAVDVFDAAQVPAAFLKTPEPPPPALDKTAIKAALKAGEDVPGARLVRGQRLEVR